MDCEEAERVRARYALGKLHNPNHDTTSYRDSPRQQHADLMLSGTFAFGQIKGRNVAG